MMNVAKCIGTVAAVANYHFRILLDDEFYLLLSILTVIPIQNASKLAISFYKMHSFLGTKFDII